MPDHRTLALVIHKIGLPLDHLTITFPGPEQNVPIGKSVREVEDEITGLQQSLHISDQEC